MIIIEENIKKKFRAWFGFNNYVIIKFTIEFIFDFILLKVKLN